jgi:hypothetical protein
MYDRGNAGPWWPFSISAYVPCISIFTLSRSKFCWYQNILGALFWNRICCVRLEVSAIDVSLITHLFTIRISIFSMSPRIDSVSFLWRAYSRSSNYFDDRCSEYFTPMPSIPVQTTELPCRGEWDSWTTCWFYITTPTVVSLFRVCDVPKLITNVAGLVGIIIYNANNCLCVIASTILGGELYTSVTSTWLNHHASHNDRSVTCHVSEIQQSADVYRYHLTRHLSRQRSDSRNIHDADLGR